MCITNLAPCSGSAVCKAASDQQEVGLEGILGKLSEKVPAIYSNIAYCTYAVDQIANLSVVYYAV